MKYSVEMACSFLLTLMQSRVPRFLCQLLISNLFCKEKLHVAILKKTNKLHVAIKNKCTNTKVKCEINMSGICTEVAPLAVLPILVLGGTEMRLPPHVIVLVPFYLSTHLLAQFYFGLLCLYFHFLTVHEQKNGYQKAIFTMTAFLVSLERSCVESRILKS